MEKDAMPEESQIVRKVKQGNKNAFKKLYEANVNILFRFLSQFSKDKDLVEDWVQKAFIKAYSNINQFQGNSKFSTWLFRIAINEMRNDLRKINSRSFEEIEENTLGSAENEIEDFEWRHDMKWLLLELDELKKSVFILFEVEGYSHSEIAEILDITESASRTSLCRTKQILKEKWLTQEVYNEQSK